ncbi:DUF1428 domain-containing protein [Candidatus Micrarchaeota archaeon]|nr:DUF1428 domain-containing protein [Candidatus Micrarchaeota archaeon]
MTYVDGFVLVIKKKNLKAYKKMATLGAKTWKKYGALQYFECIGDDLNPDMGPVKLLTFSKMTKLKKDETVWFSFIIFKSKSHRDQVNAKVMKDPSMNNPDFKDSMPFDLNRMAVGGFKVVVEK